MADRMAETGGGPWDGDSSKLERWYNDNIQEGTTAFDQDCKKAVDDVVRFLHRLCASNALFNVDRVVKGGSLGKGTMVKNLSDVDLIAFINSPHLQPIVTLGPQRYQEKLAIVIKDLHAALRDGVKIASNVWSNQFMVGFTVTVGRRSLNVDLLPTSDNCLGHGRRHSDMFKAMLQLPRDSDRDFYSASLAEHQLKFVGDKPGSVKEFIRLVKYWASEFLPKKLQKSYRLELICIYRWEAAGKPVSFSKAQGLKDVMKVLANLRGLRHYWTYIHDKLLAEMAITQLGMKNPIMLDPANPTNNVCRLYQEDGNMSVIESAAKRTLQTQLLWSVDVRRNWVD